jgi:hypothetical protein
MSQRSGIVGPIHWQRTHRLIEGRVRPNKSEHGLRSSTARHSTSTQMQRHEPSRKTLAAFACVMPASLLTLQPPDNFAIDAMDHAGGVCVGGLGVDRAIEEMRDEEDMDEDDE